MVDFFMISTRSVKKGVVEIFPKFIIRKSEDLMIRGGDFYAVWLEEKGLWSTDESDAIRLIDKELDKYAADNKSSFGEDYIKVMHLWDADSGSIDKWHKYCQKQMRDNYHTLDQKLIFENDPIVKTDYASKKLGYSLQAGSIKGYDKLISTLYRPEERHKLEWAIGAVVSGDSKMIQKFIVLYGDRGSGKSTILNIIEKLFSGYWVAFESRILGSSNSSFPLEAFKSSPLVGIEHEARLDRIEDNTRLNSLISHETMTVNEKFKNLYTANFKTFLFIATNNPVKITDAKSGLLRRLIDVRPSGDTLSRKDYDKVTGMIDFELGAIAKHCLEVYLENPGFYDDYVPSEMMSITNTFYNFVGDSFFTFKKENAVTLKSAWAMYKTYCADANVNYPMPLMVFKEELKNYFVSFDERGYMPDGSRARNLYTGFKSYIFDSDEEVETEKETPPEFDAIEFKEQPSIFDEVCKDCFAQLATEDEIPSMKWEKVKTKLKSIDTSLLHYVKVPENHIVIDFDIPDEEGKKSFKKNLEAASKWPPTYAELSKSGAGIHLHYIYPGDVSKLSRIYSEHVEIKVFNGGSSLRRKLTKCNDLPIATISSGLPTKGEKVVNSDSVKSEKGLRTLILRNLEKEIHPGTKPSCDFIKKILDDAYDSGLHYDVTDMRPAIFAFAANSSHQSEYCMSLVNQMKFQSEDISEAIDNEEADIVFFDVEIFPNLYIICWGDLDVYLDIITKHDWDWNAAWEELKDATHAMVQPTPLDVEGLLKFRLVGFNNKRYDNHTLYARLMGYNNEQLFKLSIRLINSKKNEHPQFNEAYNISYTDIWDYAANKQGLKKWEIQLGIHHQELGIPWDQPVPEELWDKVADYCKNDVVATYAVWVNTQEDFTAREILADLADGNVNMSTNTLICKLIFGNDRRPTLVYTDLATGEQWEGR